MPDIEVTPPFFWLGREADPEVIWEMLLRHSDVIPCRIEAYVPTPDGLRKLEEPCPTSK